MSWMLSIWVAAALLALCRGENTVQEASSHYSENGGYRFNATVTVKADYEQMMSTDKGHLNHTRLLQAMVIGALDSDVSVYYLSSWPVHPYRTATSLLIDCNFTVSLQSVTSKLHLLLRHIQEVSSVTVEDVDECAEPALRQCSPVADCNNTVGSYHCACRQEYVDVDPRYPGAHCEAASTTTEPPLTYLPPMNTTYTPTSSTTQDLQGSSTMGLFNFTETSMTTALSNTSHVTLNSSHVPQWTSSALYTSMSSTVESTLPTTACSPPNIITLRSANVTGTSFCIYWLTDIQMNQTYLVVVSNVTSVVTSSETNQTMLEVTGLQPGVLHNVTVTPCACGRQGTGRQISVRTDAQTLDATARLANINFTADLQNTSSQLYKNLSASFVEEIYQSLSPEMKALVDSGQVRIEITGFSPGSVVVNFIIFAAPSTSQDISNVSTALLHSLKNSTKYTVTNTSSNKIRESSLYLGLPDCGVNGGNATHAQLTVAWNECNTTLDKNDTYYTASVTLFNSMESYTSPSGTEETPKIRLAVPVMCHHMKDLILSADFNSIGYDIINNMIIGTGSFQVIVRLMNGTIPLPQNYSLSPDEAVVVEVSLNTSSEQIKVVINKCWATRTQNPAESNSHVFLENGCSLNTYTNVLMNGNSSTSQVSVKLFSFINLDVLYLHCQVQICAQIGSETCVPDCLQRTARTSKTIGTAFGSLGPIHKSEGEDKPPGEEDNTLYMIGLSCLGIGLTLFFIIGFVCLFYYQRNRIGHYNFSVKPKQENFTYLVFNT
ncbi:Uromodulin-like 1 [Collichthys lucidus]|uniref:Uromodulin-like 1 n=1 Tax=Collichthys lucidus TaxID=240159 RepID=A0A4U5VAH4_COLLU|nr:Uromodulin-like 1 [Collichthys lucidus]